MRSLLALALVLLGPALPGFAQTCTGLCQQQVSCPGGGTTSVTGIVYAPNGTDPLPNVQVYIPNAPVDAFTPGVACPVVGAAPSGSPLVGTTTAVDGTFTLTNVPVGTNIPLVVQSGRWRRQVVVPSVASCTNTVFSVNMPRSSSEGDIPKIAIATGAVDAVECVLRKVGLKDTEFTDPSGTGRVNLYLATGAAGAGVDSATPSASTLLSSTSTLNSYDVLMLPCEGSTYPAAKTATEYANLVNFANIGGRVYSSHFSYQWLYQNVPFNTVANWAVNQAQLPDGVATINAAFSGGQELSQWLQLVGATTTPGQMPISTLRHDLNGVIAPTEAWMTLNDVAAGNPVMQMVFDTPVGSTGNQCGRVLFDEYHVENASSSPAISFPAECAAGPMTPQEKLLEYTLFELTNNGSAATLTPAAQDFGSQPVGFNSAAQNFIWTNKSTFTASVTLLTGSGDFSILGSNPCTAVPANTACTIPVVFNPTALGARTGLLTVGSNGSTLTASLTGIGVPALVLTPADLTFGSLDVGATASQTLTITNAGSGPLPMVPLLTTGDYTASSNCGTTVAAGSRCTVTVVFKPSTNGTRTGTLTLQTPVLSPPSTMTGNGLDFALSTSPASGSVIAGNGSSTAVTTTPLSGFNANVHLSCTTNAPGSNCGLGASSVTPTSATTTSVTITTTSKYSVVGYTGGFTGWLSLAGVASGLLLWMRRRALGPVVRRSLTLAAFALLSVACSVGLSGCSDKLPTQNANYTTPGTYTYTVTATDGFLVRSTTYSLTVTAN